MRAHRFEKPVMIDALKPYPMMKDSGVVWLGNVPEHWEVRPVGGMGSLFKGNGGNKGDEVSAGIPCVRYGDLYTRHEFFIKKSKAYVSKERSGAYTPIRHGDVLFAASGETEEDIGRSSVNLIEGEARCGGDVLVLRPEIQAVPRYLGYAADSPASRNQKACMGRGFTVVHIYGSQLKRLLLPLPPLSEQLAIVRFLDHADGRIRRYIRAKQMLIKLLEEQKQAIIHHAVTRGLDAKVRLKPSGVEWLGDVPEHWEVKRCRFVFREIDRRSVDGSEKHLSMSQRLGLVPSHLVENRTLIADSYAGGKLCQLGDLVLNRLKAHLGVFALARHAGVISPDYTVFRPIEPGGVEYFERVLRSPSCRRELRIRAKGIVEGFWRLYTDDFYDIQLPVPSPRERIQIVDRINADTRDVEQAISRAEREIALLREYRTRLIADVVTGKLDVREAAARLPDESAEDVPMDEDEARADGDSDAGDGEGDGAEEAAAALDE